MKIEGLILLIGLSSAWAGVCAQQDPVWDDTQSSGWPPEARKVGIMSSADETVQQAYVYEAPGNEPRPLIVSLHTWSGNYEQKDTVFHLSMERGYHYIHPDFRGPNNRPEACGSDLVVSDIDDAITWALENFLVDRRQIHVIGVSGGGHATMLTYMKSQHSIRSFSAYVGIYNLVDWYYESRGRGTRYAADIVKATVGTNGVPDMEEARRRSPYFMRTPLKRKYSTLYLYAGIHDGFTGSVPVSQTLQLYNKIVADFLPRRQLKREQIPEAHILIMLAQRGFPGAPQGKYFMSRRLIYRKQLKDLVHLTIFEGGHEMPSGDVLSWLPQK